MTLSCPTFSNGITDFFLLLPNLSFMLYHFHFQKLIEINHEFSWWSLAFVSLEEFVEFIDPFLSKRGRGEKRLPSEAKSFFVPRPSTEEGEREAKVWGKGKEKNTRPATSNFFTNTVHAIDAKDCCSSRVPPRPSPLCSREDSSVEIRVDSRFHGSAMISPWTEDSK